MSLDGQWPTGVDGAASATDNPGYVRRASKDESKNRQKHRLERPDGSGLNR